MPDLEVTCVQCSEVFLFTEKEQGIFYARNMMAPQRCPACRTKKAAAAEGAPKKFEIVCDHCGRHDKVPFQPKLGRPVLCRECFDANRSKARAM